MADYFTHLSAVIDKITDDESGWVEDHLKNSTWEMLGYEHGVSPENAEEWRDARSVYACEEESWPGFDWSILNNPSGKSLWLHDDGGVVNIDQLATFVSLFLEKFHPDEVFTCTWADTCSRPRLAAFGGGGALVVTAKTWETMTTGAMCDQLEKELKDE